MSWFRIDDRLPNSRKVLAIPRQIRCAAIGLWSMAGAWCMDELTDGRLPKFMVEELAGTPELAEALVKCGLWYDEPDEYVFHDWADWQPSRDEVMEKREKNAARLRAWREQKARENEARNSVTNSVTNTVTNGGGNSVGTLSPTRPDPTRPDPLLKTPSSADADAVFERFWNLYPKKVEKQAARRKWNTTVKRVDPEVVIAGLERYVEFWRRKGTERQFIKGPEVWLNKGCWADDLGAAEPENRRSEWWTS